MNSSRSIHAGHAALRKGRASVAGQLYFITVCCQQRKPLMQSFAAACAASRCLHQLNTGIHVNLLAWVLMPDHMHLLIELSESQLLSVCMGRINSCVAKAINRALDRKDAVWQGAYFDRALRRDEDVATVIHYMLHNPIRAGLAETMESYPFWNITNWQGGILNLD